mmetsp:Transcript_13009/g.20176  ORF Transcript_13009/g.20176 Transcript_13009/m.20176 type:complete len:141 (-) Transcript_13009:779-1201(-)
MVDLVGLQLDQEDELVIDVIKDQAEDISRLKAGFICHLVISQQFDQNQKAIGQDSDKLVEFLVGPNVLALVRCLGFFRWAMWDRCDSLFRIPNFLKWWQDKDDKIITNFVEALKEALEYDDLENEFTFFNMKWFFPRRVA